ncbi:hypothetical protein C0989_003998 [Termitomyces sp. Mn162]|nr:hypothetical protein C0989_003998 [Termitomyces sp. Mn162]
MSAYNPLFNPAGYPTDIYGRPLPENYYTRFYPGLSMDHQRIPPGWCCPPTFPADGNHPCVYPGGFAGAPSAPPNPAYLPPAHYYTYSVPTVVPTPLKQPDNIPSLNCHFLLKSLLPPDNNKLKPMFSSVTKSSTPSTSHPWNLQDMLAPSLSA